MKLGWVAEAGDGFADSVQNFDVAAAAAQVPGEVGPNLFIGGIGILVQQRLGGEQNSGCAVGALESRAVKERLLDRVKLGGIQAKALRGEQIMPLRHRGECDARANRSAVDQHRARAAHADPAALAHANQL